MSDAEVSAASQPGSSDRDKQARRQFLKKVGWAGATVPAVSLLLAANFQRASAQVAGGSTASGGSGSS